MMSSNARTKKAQPIRKPDSSRSRIDQHFSPNLGDLEIDADNSTGRDYHEINTVRLDKFQPDVQGDGWPIVGGSFDGFRIVRELGHGAFGRVYLATQGDLADRSVALKVCPDALMESQALAQLQHPNIVPIHSLHKQGNLHAVCMPFLGSTTLADVLSTLQQKIASNSSASHLGRSRKTRDLLTKPSPTDAAAAAIKPLPGSRWMERLSHVEGILKTMRDLAAGLAHAHERGIMHRDLKPANVLLTDDGQAMLLDFNLSHDVKKPSEDATSRVGGTVPYMSPEQLQWFYTQSGIGVDERADVYSLGVMFYELLTLKLPYRLHTNSEDWLNRMLHDREQLPESPRRWDRHISPAVESMAMHCLEPDPRRRYSSVRQLHEDLRRHLDHLPLRHAPDPSRWERTKNWFRRRPKFAAGLGVGIAATVALVSVGAMHLHRVHDFALKDAKQRFIDFERESERKICLLSVGTAERELVHDQKAAVFKLLDRYQVLSNPSWRESENVRLLSDDDRSQLLQTIGDMYLQLGYADWLQGQASNDPKFRRASFEKAMDLNRKSESFYHSEAIPKALWMQRKTLCELLGDQAGAKDCAVLIKQTPIRSDRERMLVVSNHTAHREFQKALVFMTQASSAMVANDFWGLFLRGVAHKSRSEYIVAAACFSGCIALRSDLPEPYVFRARCFNQLKLFDAALSDLNFADEHPDVPFDVFLVRASLKQKLDDLSGALKDAELAVEYSNGDPNALRLRSKLRKENGDSLGAGQDLEEAGRSAAKDEDIWVKLGWQARETNVDRAVECWNKALAINPMSRAALHMKSLTLLRNRGRDIEALETLDRLVRIYSDDLIARQGRGLVNARLGNVDAARVDAVDCLAADKQPSTYYHVALIYAQASTKSPADADEALRLLRRAFLGNHGRDLAVDDPDLAPLRTDGRLQKLLADTDKITHSNKPRGPTTPQSESMPPRRPRGSLRTYP